MMVLELHSLAGIAQSQPDSSNQNVSIPNRKLTPIPTSLSSTTHKPPAVKWELKNVKTRAITPQVLSLRQKRKERSRERQVSKVSTKLKGLL